MDQQEEEIVESTTNVFNFPSLNHSAWFEIMLFYVRISSCVFDSVPNHLTLRHPNRQIGVSLEINGSHVPAASEATPFTLRCDRVDKESTEVIYVSTDIVCVTESLEFEVYEKETLFLCGSLERLEADWVNNRNMASWSIHCHVAKHCSLEPLEHCKHSYFPYLSPTNWCHDECYATVVDRRPILVTVG